MLSPVELALQFACAAVRQLDVAGERLRCGAVGASMVMASIDARQLGSG
jgi:hypothetical protein